MPANRLLPTEEAVDLIGLVRDLATRELRPGWPRPRPRRPSRARCSARWVGPACWACPTPRSTAAAASPTRSTSRSSRRSAPSGPASASASPCTRSPASAWRPRGTEEQRQRWLPEHARRRAARRLLPLRAARRLRPRRDAHPRPARRRRLRASTAPRPGPPTAATPTSTR